MSTNLALRLAGHEAVEASARRVQQYRYAVERMMRIMAGWIALTPELSAKLLLGRQVWDCAQHADQWGKRLPELRLAAQSSEPSSAAFVAFMDELASPAEPPQTVERLVGIYRVLKPHLLAAYAAHLGEANVVYEPPTRRILEHAAADERRHIAAGETVLEHLITTPALADRAHRWWSRLEGMLAAAAGVTGRGLPPAAAAPSPGPAPELSDDAHEFIRLEQRGQPWLIPEPLRGALDAVGHALVAVDEPGVRRWLSAQCSWDRDGQERLGELGLDRHHVVAFAKLGHQRLVKLRLDGSRGALTLISRWVCDGAEWRATVLEVAGFELHAPA